MKTLATSACLVRFAIVSIAMASWNNVAYSQTARVHTHGVIVDGRPFEELLNDFQGIKLWPENPDINNGGPVFFTGGTKDGGSRHRVPADTFIFTALGSNLVWDHPSRCLQDDLTWDPLPLVTREFDARMRIWRDRRVWLNGMQIDFDHDQGRFTAPHTVAYPPGTFDNCIGMPHTAGALIRPAASSGMFVLIEPLPPGGPYSLKYTHSSGEMRTREFFVRDGLIGDLDRSRALDSADIDMITAGMREGSLDLLLDVDRNSIVNEADRIKWVEELASTSFGDADLNGRVEFPDFLALAAAFGQEGGWAEGDFDGNGTVAFPDFLTLAANFQGSSANAASVPEPGSLLLGMVALVTVARLRKRRTVR